MRFIPALTVSFAATFGGGLQKLRFIPALTVSFAATFGGGLQKLRFIPALTLGLQKLRFFLLKLVHKILHATL